VHVVRSLKARERTTDDLLRERSKKSRLASQDQEGRGVHAYALPKSRERSGDDLLRRSNEKKNSRLPSLVLAGAPQKTEERLVDDLFNLGEKTKATSATAYALPAKSAGSAPAVQCSRSLSKSLRDRLQGHDRGMPRKNKCRMPCFVQTGAPCKGQGAPSRRPFQPGRENKSRKHHGLRAPCKKRRERSGCAVQPVTSQEPT
jgi:hypothetical protein